MIRRGFWLTAGAVAGVYGYRRVSAFGRRLSGRLPPRGKPRRRAVAVARETVRFARDVREGMDIYMARRPAPARRTLATSTRTDHEDGH